MIDSVPALTIGGLDPRDLTRRETFADLVHAQLDGAVAPAA